MSALMQNPMFFYAVAFFAFLALAYVYARKPALQWLDDEIAAIRKELDTAAQLRAEAEATLADCKAKQTRAENEAKLILAQATKDVEDMRTQAAADLAASLVRYEQLSTERIRMVEAEAIADVRAAAIALAMEIARKTLTEKMTDGDAVRLIDQAIADVPSLKTAKAKAA